MQVVASVAELLLYTYTSDPISNQCLFVFFLFFFFLIKIVFFDKLFSFSWKNSVFKNSDVRTVRPSEVTLLINLFSK